MNIQQVFYFLGSLFFLLLLLLIIIFTIISLRTYLKLKKTIQNISDQKLLISTFQRTFSSPIKVLLPLLGLFITLLKTRRKNA